MIILTLISLFDKIISAIFNVLPDIPSLPSDLIDSVNSMLDIIFGYIGLLDMFVPLNIVMTLVPLALLLHLVEENVQIFSWLIKKIPFLGVN